MLRGRRALASPSVGTAVEPITLGRYQLLKLLARGGMAEIFAARVTGDYGFEKIVVIKRMLPSLACDDECVTMFLDEARIAATLHHPNIVHVYDVGSADGQYFMSMEYLHGKDLRSLLMALRAKREHLPLEHALHVVSGVLSGLHSAHEKVGFDGKPLDVVHRDVTPQNIFISYDGSVKVVDFGIAKASNAQSRTQHGKIKGKVAYLSPEQCRRQRLDRRSDIYAAGIILYELTTGRRLYHETDKLETLRQITEDPVKPPSLVVPGYPDELERIVMVSLAKDRGNRYPTALAMLADLEGFVRSHGLAVSSIGMAHFMAKIFGHQAEAWRAAEASASPPQPEASDLSEVATLPISTTPLGDDTEVGMAWVAEASEASARHEAHAASTPEDAGPASPATTAAIPIARGVHLPWLDLFVAAAVACSVIFLLSMREAEPVVAAAQLVPAELEHRSTPSSFAVSDDPPAAPPPAPVPAPVRDDDRLEVSPPPKEVRHRARRKRVVAGDPPSESKARLDPPPAEAVGDRGDDDEDADGRARADAEGGREDGRHAPLPEEGLPAASPTSPAPPASPASPETGELRVDAAISCEVMVEGEARGFTPLVLQVPPGRYTLRCQNARFGVDTLRAVEIKPGQVTKERF